MGERNLTLLTDLYELTMMQGYFKSNSNETVVFDVFYRKNPSDSGYAIFCGLEQAIDYIKNLNFSYDDIEYLRSLEIFGEDFLDYLSSFHFSGDIYAMPEGSVVFPREPLRQVFQGRIIGIDPGHGGKDRGVKGPVNLLEKDVSMSIARELQDLLLGCGAVPVMTRTDDATIGHEERLRTLRNRSAELCVQVHVSGHRDPHWQKYRWFAKKGCGQSVSLGMNIGEALLERMGIRIEGPGALPDAIWDSTPFPVAQIEPLCLTHLVDEANFRAPLFRKRIGQAIYNGIHRWILASRRKAS